MSTRPFAHRPPDRSRPSADDVLLEFHSERPLVRHREGRLLGLLGWAAGLVVCCAAIVAGIWYFRTVTSVAPQTNEGTLRIESEPAGAAVEVDGALRGLTPLTVRLAPGEHAVVISHDALTQELTAQVTKGAETVHHVKWPDLPVANATGPAGRLEVVSDPPGARVIVDGLDRGVSPLVISDLADGAHEVQIQHLGRTHRHTVSVAAGDTTSLVLTNTAGDSGAGWLAPRASTRLQIYEAGMLIGTTDTDRIMLSAGTHHLDFVSEELGFRARRSISVAAGQTSAANISLPQAPVQLDAAPWAEVWIDGRSVGQTPVTTLLLPIGIHDIEFRHPEHGTRTERVTVSLIETPRVTVDMGAH